MISPTPGFAFVIEDKKDDTTKGGIALTETSRGMKVVGTIYQVTNEKGGFLYELFLRFFASKNDRNYKKGDRIIFSRYVTEDCPYIEDEEGKEIEGLFFISTSLISATIHG